MSELLSPKQEALLLLTLEAQFTQQILLYETLTGKMVDRLLFERKDGILDNVTIDSVE